MINQNDTNIFLRHKPEPVWCYRSGLTVYEERFLDGALISDGWNGAGYPLDDLTNYRSLYITSGMAMVLPPEQVDRLVSGMG